MTNHIGDLVKTIETEKYTNLLEDDNGGLIIGMCDEGVGGAECMDCWL
jgi:hypothetical protein